MTLTRPDSLMREASIKARGRGAITISPSDIKKAKDVCVNNHCLRIEIIVDQKPQNALAKYNV
jgi:hypothetical protein